MLQTIRFRWTKNALLILSFNYGMNHSNDSGCFGAPNVQGLTNSKLFFSFELNKSIPLFIVYRPHESCSEFFREFVNVISNLVVSLDTIINCGPHLTQALFFVQYSRYYWVECEWNEVQCWIQPNAVVPFILYFANIKDTRHSDTGRNYPDTLRPKEPSENVILISSP